MKLTGKEGCRISQEKIDFYDLKIRALLEVQGQRKFTDEEWSSTWRQSHEYEQMKKILLGRDSHSYTTARYNRMAELLLVRKCINEEIELLNMGIRL